VQQSSNETAQRYVPVFAQVNKEAGRQKTQRKRRRVAGGGNENGGSAENGRCRPSGRTRPSRTERTEKRQETGGIQQRNPEGSNAVQRTDAESAQVGETQNGSGNAEVAAGKRTQRIQNSRTHLRKICSNAENGEAGE